MADETAVLEQVTAEEQSLALGEQLDADTAETEEIAQTETDATEDETPSEPASPFAGKSFDEIAEDPEVSRVIKDRLAKAEESARQKAEVERSKALREQQLKQYQEQLQRAQNSNAQWAANALKSVVDKVVKDGDDFDPNATAFVAQQLSMSASVAATEQLVKTVEDYLGRNHSEFRIPQELVFQFQQAQASQSVPGMQSALFSIQEAALRDSLTKQIRSEIEKELADEAEKTAKVQQEKAAATKAKAAPRPQSAAGAPANPQNARAILADPSKTKAQKAAAFKALYGIDPP